MIKNKKIEYEAELNEFQGQTKRGKYLFDILISFVLLIVVFSIYSNSYDVPFRFDDIPAIMKNHNVQADEFTFSDIIIKPSTGFAKMRILPMISFAVNFYFGRFDVYGYHFVNIFIHSLSTLLIFFLFRNTLFLYGSISGKSKSFRDYTFLAFWGALLWSVNPLHSNSVTYIVQRMNLMAMLFTVLSLFCYVKGRIFFNSSNKTSKKKIYSPILFSISLISGLMAVFSKQNVAVLPLIIIVYEFFFFQKFLLNKRNIIIACALIICFIFGIIVLSYIWFDTFNPIHVINSSYSARDFSLWQRVMTEWRILWYYFLLLIFPLYSRMQLVYDYTLSTSLINPYTTLVSLFSIVCIIILCFKYAKKFPLIVFCISWFLIFNLVESTVIGIELIYEHRTYIPSLFLFLMLATVLYRIINNKIILNIIFGVLALFFMWNTFQRNNMWRNSEAFWAANYQKAKNGKRDLLNYGKAVSEIGKLEEAKNKYSRILEMDPDHYIAHHNLANILTAQRFYKEAEKHIRKAIEIKPSYTSAYVVLGSILNHTDRPDEALEAFRKASLLHPDNPIILSNIASVYRDRKEWDKAKYYYIKALDIKPEMLSASLDLSLIYLKIEKYNQSENVLKNSLEYHKNNPELYYRLGLVSMEKENYDNAVMYFKNSMLLDPEFHQIKENQVKENYAQANLLRGNVPKAIKYYEVLLEKDQNDYNAYSHLGLIYLKEGELAQAEANFQKALELKPDLADALKGMGSLYYMSNLFSEAESYYLKAIEIVPNDSSLHNNIGSVYAKQRKYQEAADSYRRAIDIKPDYIEAKMNLEKVLKKLNNQK